MSQSDKLSYLRDSDHVNRPECVRLRLKTYQWEAQAIHDAFVDRLRISPDHSIDRVDLDLTAHTLGYDLERLVRIIDVAVEVGLLVDTAGEISSPDLDEKMDTFKGGQKSRADRSKKANDVRWARHRAAKQGLPLDSNGNPPGLLKDSPESPQGVQPDSPRISIGEFSNPEGAPDTGFSLPGDSRKESPVNINKYNTNQSNLIEGGVGGVRLIQADCLAGYTWLRIAPNDLAPLIDAARGYGLDKSAVYRAFELCDGWMKEGGTPAAIRSRTLPSHFEKIRGAFLRTVREERSGDVRSGRGDYRPPEKIPTPDEAWERILKTIHEQSKDTFSMFYGELTTIVVEELGGFEALQRAVSQGGELIEKAKQSFLKAMRIACETKMAG